jgi:hypothetical protein
MAWERNTDIVLPPAQGQERTTDDIIAISEQVRKDTNRITYMAIEFQGSNSIGNGHIKIANGAAAQVSSINIQ